MAGAGNQVIRRVKSLKIGAVGAAESACTDVGSVRDAEYKPVWTENKATAADLMDSTVAVVRTAYEGEFTMTCESITAFNVAMAMGGSIDGSGRIVMGPTLLASGGEPPYATIYVDGYLADGSPVRLHVKKATVKSGAGWKLSKDQQILTIGFICLALYTEPAGEEVAATDPSPADTTPPTVSTWSPANSATNVAKAATTLVVLTFSEAVRVSDVLNPSGAPAVGVFRADTGAAIAGTWAANAAGTVYTFTPSGAYPATTSIVTFASAGIRDVAGNKLAATSTALWTTGS